MRLPQRGFAFFTAFVVSVMLALGFWQIERLRWKNDLIEKRDARAQSEPLSLPPSYAWRDTDWDALYFRNFILRGEADSSKTLRIFIPHPVYGAAHRIVSPFRLAQGGDVLVDWGILPARDSSRGVSDLPAPKQFRAILLPPQRRIFFDPPPDLQKGLWFKNDPQSMSQYAKIAAPPGIFQINGSPPPLNNRHLSYAVTWFALALVCSVLYLLRRKTATKPHHKDSA